MMKTYVRIHEGQVFETIEPAVYDTEDSNWQEGAGTRIGQEIPLSERYTAEFVSTCVDITGIAPEPLPGWSYDGDEFSPPPLYAQNPDEVMRQNVASRDMLLSQSTLAINPLQDAVDLDVATAEEIALLKKWKQYRIAVNRVDLSQSSPVWPPQP